LINQVRYFLFLYYDILFFFFFFFSSRRRHTRLQGDWSSDVCSSDLFSPDGKWIAFTGQYDGNFNVYVMPAEGGQPKQLTFYQGSAHPLNDRMGIHDEVVTWTPDSKRIVFLSRRDATNGWIKRPFTVSIDGGLPEPLPVKEGGLTSFSPDGTKIAYNQIVRNFRTW